MLKNPQLIGEEQYALPQPTAKKGQQAKLERVRSSILQSFVNFKQLYVENDDYKDCLAQYEDLNGRMKALENSKDYPFSMFNTSRQIIALKELIQNSNPSQSGESIHDSQPGPAKHHSNHENEMRGAEGRQTRRRQKGAAAKQMVTGFKRSSSQSDEGRTKLRSGGPRQAAKGAPNGPANGLMGVNGKRGAKQ